MVYFQKRKFLTIFFILININFLFSQDSIFYNIDKKFEESIIRQDQLFDFYKDDFNDWKDKVDLTNEDLLTDREKIILESNKYLGVPYLWGGNTPKAFDCSGLVVWTLKKAINLIIPRTTLQQYQKWSIIIEKDMSKIKNGDLVYFKTFGTNPVSHVGIYTGNNTFIHSPKKNDYVKKSKILGFWKDNLIGFVNIEKII